MSIACDCRVVNNLNVDIRNTPIKNVCVFFKRAQVKVKNVTFAISQNVETDRETRASKCTNIFFF